MTDPLNHSTTYTCDALDRRIGRREGATRTATLYDGKGTDPLLDFVNGATTPAARYLNGPQADIIDMVLARQTSGGVAWYLPDRLGTIRDLGDKTGALIDHVDYGAFGNVLSESSPSNGDRLVGFAGLERDTATGLNLAVHRVEDPATGRWDSEDPEGLLAGDANLYRYVANGPTDSTDPTGLGPYPKPPTDPECIRLMQRIENVRRRIGRRISNLRENEQLLNLPEGCPGDDLKPGLSKRGHRRLINEDRKLLASLEAEYCWKCTGYNPPVLPPPVQVPVTVPTPQPSPKNPPYGVIVGAGLIVGGILIIGGTIIEDFLTGGVGTLDDPPHLGWAAL